MSVTTEMFRLSLAVERASQFLHENEKGRRILKVAVQMQQICCMRSTADAFCAMCEVEDQLFVKFLEWEEKQL